MAYTLQHDVWKLPIKFQDPTVYSCWEKCDEKFHIQCQCVKCKSIRQTGGGYDTTTKMGYTLQYDVWKLPIKFHDPTVYSCWEKCDEKVHIQCECIKC